MKTLDEPVKAVRGEQKPEGKKGLFEPVFVATVGGATLGGYFGLPGALVGAVLGAGFGFYYSHVG